LPALHWDAAAPWVTTNGRWNFTIVETNGANRFFRLRATP